MAFTQEQLDKYKAANPEKYQAAVIKKMNESELNSGSPAGNPGFSFSSPLFNRDTKRYDAQPISWLGEGDPSQEDKNMFASWVNSQNPNYNMTGDFATKNWVNPSQEYLDSQGMLAEPAPVNTRPDPSEVPNLTQTSPNRQPVVETETVAEDAPSPTPSPDMLTANDLIQMQQDSMSGSQDMLSDLNLQGRPDQRLQMLQEAGFIDSTGNPTGDFGESYDSRLGVDDMIALAEENGINLVEQVGDDRYRVTDIGFGVSQDYINTLTDMGLLPEVDERGWEEHRQITNDGQTQTAISYNEDEANLGDYFQAAVPALVGTMVTGGLGGGLFGGLAGGAASGITNSHITGEWDVGDIITDAIAGAGAGYLGGPLGPDDAAFGLSDAGSIVRSGIARADDNLDNNPPELEAPPEAEQTGPWIGDTPVASRPGWHWERDSDSVSGWRAVRDEVDTVEQSEQGGGSPTPASPVPSGGWGSDNLPPAGAQVDANHEAKDDETWRHTNPDGSVVAGNEMGEVWEVEGQGDNADVITPGFDFPTDGTSNSSGYVEYEDLDYDTTGPDIPNETNTPSDGTGTGDGTGSGSGEGDGDGDGDGDGEGDGFGPGLAFAASGVSDAEWSELFPYTKLTPLQKKKLAVHIDYLRAIR